MIECKACGFPVMVDYCPNCVEEVEGRTCTMEKVAWPGDDALLYVCSECLGKTYTEDAPNYCAWCGAKVDEVREAKE